MVGLTIETFNSTIAPATRCAAPVAAPKSEVDEALAKRVLTV
jgi:hypothetical protein